MRLASAVLAACAAALIASDSSAEDAPGKPEAVKPLRLTLAPDKTYLFRLAENTAVRRTKKPSSGRYEIEDSATEIVWDVGVSQQEVTQAGDTIVSVMPARVRGAFTDPAGKQTRFDSDDPKDTIRSPLLGRGLRVRLSPTAQVKSVCRVGIDREDAGEIIAVDLVSDLEGVIHRQFAAQFFQALPETAPDASTAWNQTRALAPEWVLKESKVGGYSLGYADERFTVQKVLPDVVVASLRSEGKTEARSEKAPESAFKMSPESFRFGGEGELLDEWLVVGEVRLRRDTGLVGLRTARTTIRTHVDPKRIATLKLRGGSTIDLDTDPEVCVHQISLRLDLVDVR